MSEGMSSGEVIKRVKNSAAAAPILTPTAAKYRIGYPPIKQSKNALIPIKAAV